MVKDFDSKRGNSLRRLRPAGGYVTIFVTALALGIDYWLVKRSGSPACCAIHDHVSDVISGAGVAVAFVLTYLAALVALSSPGRQLLSSALSNLKEAQPELAAIDDEVFLTEDHFVSFRAFAQKARDLAPHSPDVEKASIHFTQIVNLARPAHRRENPSADELEALGYNHFRAAFLASMVFKRDVEKRNLIRASVLGAIVFSYAVLMKVLDQYGVMKSSFALMYLGYSLLVLMAVSISSALALRMWPHRVDPALIEPMLAPIEQESERRAKMLATDGMTSIVENVKRATGH